MKELLKKLVESEILTEETKKELEEAINTYLEEAKNELRKEIDAEVRAELTEKWVEEREALVEALDSKVGELLEKELKELRDDVERYRDLEVEYAKKLNEEKKNLANAVKNDLKELVEKLDSFLEYRIAAEFEELREDLEEQKKVEFGRKIFEAFVDEYLNHYYDGSSTVEQLRELSEQVETLQTRLATVEREKALLERKAKLDELLEPLNEHQREVMKVILKNVETERLEEAYNKFVGRVLAETKEHSEEEGTVLTEAEGNAEKTVDLSSASVRTGDSEPLFKHEEKQINESLEQLKKLAGIK